MPSTEQTGEGLLDRLREETDLDLSRPYDADSIGPNNSGDICPLCSDVLDYDQTAVRAHDGERGGVLELAPDSVAVVLFCEDCWTDVKAEVRAVQNHALGEWSA